MLQVFHLDDTKVDLVLHMLQWDPLAAAAAAAGAQLWVAVRTPEAGRRIRNAHPQAGQVTGTHMGVGGPEAEGARERSDAGRSRLCKRIPCTRGRAAGVAPYYASALDRTSER